jgi:hypothetical protein
MLIDKETIQEVIDSFMEDYKEPHEELDWWMYDEECAYNIHNYNADDVNAFKIDVYPNAEGQDKPDYNDWDTVMTFNFNELKQGDKV